MTRSSFDRPRTGRSTRGLTLVEVLVSLAVLSIVLAALFALTRGTLRFTNLTGAISTSVEDIADAEGYLTDTFREAKLVLSNFDMIDASGPTTRTFHCDVALNHDCVGVLSPVVDETNPAQPIVNFDLSVFVVEPIGDRYETYGIPRGWQGPETLTLFEYRHENVCSSSCSTVTHIDMTSSVRTIERPPGFLLGDLAGTDGAGNPVRFFALDASDTNFFLNFVVRANAAAGNPYVVRETPVALQVAVRR